MTITVKLKVDDDGVDMDTLKSLLVKMNAVNANWSSAAPRFGSIDACGQTLASGDITSVEVSE